jgi:hypothetical protein
MRIKVRKKPVEIEAIEIDGGSENLIEIAKWLGESFLDSGPNGEIYISTLEGDMRGDVGDLILRGVRGEFYPIKREIFEETYEIVEE